MMRHWIAIVFGLFPTALFGTDARANQYLPSLSQQLAPQARDALQQIDDAARKLLAARSYVRAGNTLESRWSWSAQQIEFYATTDEYRELLADVERVADRFEAQNPGYTLYANTDVRSLDVQIERWNDNRSVGKVAAQLQRAVETELSRDAYPAQPSARSLERFRKFLRQWRPTMSAPLAAPGLSLHGQLRAVDFQIMKGDAIVATAEVAAAAPVWENQGWSRKLKAAVAGSRFTGPLRSPNEPWHYEYVAPSQRRSDPASRTRASGKPSSEQP